MFNNTFYELKKTAFKGEVFNRYTTNGADLSDPRHEPLEVICESFPVKLFTVVVDSMEELQTFKLRYSKLPLKIEPIPNTVGRFEITFKYSFDKELEQLVYLFIHKEMSYIDHLESTLSSQKVSLNQYESLRINFNKMLDGVLGKDYYNLAHDVYTADQFSCESITRKANRSLWQHFKDVLFGEK